MLGSGPAEIADRPKQPKPDHVVAICHGKELRDALLLRLAHLWLRQCITTLLRPRSAVLVNQVRR